jgi:hypothetical protein
MKTYKTTFFQFFVWVLLLYYVRDLFDTVFGSDYTASDGRLVNGDWLMNIELKSI